MELKNLVATLRARWRSVAAMLLLALALCTVAVSLQPRTYESHSRLYVTVDAALVSELFSASVYVSGRVKSYASFAEQNELLETVIEDLNLNTTPQELSDRVSAEVEPETQIIKVRATDSKPTGAQILTQKVAENLAAYIEELETPRGKKRPQVSASITDSADFNPEAASPRVVLSFAAATLIGLILGVALAATREALDNTVKLVAQIEGALEAPVIASIPHDRRAEEAPLISEAAGYSARSEAFRVLRTNLQYLSLDNNPRSLVVTSSIASEGKTHTAVNLALALWEAGQRVILVDGDLRRRRAAEMLGLDRSIGLINAVVGKAELIDVVQAHAATGMPCLASGPVPPNPSEILQTEATAALIRQLRETYDYVIVDAPPLLPVADATILSSHADGIVLVVRYGETRVEELAAAGRRLRTVGPKSTGAVFNMMPRRAKDGYDTYAEYYEA